ncbi:MAG: hypothetical protein GY928_16285 [Colwellia sp.]|nr:hypothetical protein [Colwellia sp.]
MKNLVVSIITSKQFKETRVQEKELEPRRIYTMAEKLNFLAKIIHYKSKSEAADDIGIPRHNAHHWVKAYGKGTLHA